MVLFLNVHIEHSKPCTPIVSNYELFLVKIVSNSAQRFLEPEAYSISNLFNFTFSWLVIIARKFYSNFCIFL